jgi:outer membrane protein
MGNYHHVTIGVGTTVVNQAYNQAYFGITPSSINFSFSVKNTLNPEAPITTETARLGFRGYRATAGVKDMHADIFWTWNLSSSWLLTSHLNMTRLVGSAAESPLVDRRNNLTISSAIAYRF